MKTLTAAAQEISQRAGVEPRFLVKIEFTTPGTFTLRLSDQPITALGFDWLPLVDDWGTLALAMNELDLGAGPATATLTLNNSKAVEGTTASRLSDLIYSPRNLNGFQWAFAKVTVYVLLDPSLTSGDEVTSGVFYLEDPQELGSDTISVTMSDLSLLLEDKLQITKVTRDVFTSATEAIGQEIPRAWGVIKGVRAIPVVDGAVSGLDADITSGATSLTLEDATLFPASGTVQIDSEHIAYSSKSGNTLNGLTRAQNSTTAAAHTAQTNVYEVRSGTNAYRFAVGEHDATFKTKAISKIRVNGRAARTSPTTQLDATDIVTGKRFAVISFTPGNVRKFHLEPIEGATLTTSGSIDAGPANPVPDTSFTPSFSLSSEAVVTNVTGYIEFSFSRVGGTWNGHAAQLWAGAVTTGQLLWDAVAPETFTGSANFEIGSSLTNMPIIFHVRTIGGGPGTNDLHVTVTITSYVATVSTSPFGGDGVASNVIGEVTCDVEGIKDDGSGTITGVASTLLENPADIAKVIHLSALPGIVSGDFGSTWATTRTRLSALGYKWAFLLGGMTYSDLRRELGQQARSALYISAGKIEYAFLADSPEAVKALDYASDVDVSRPAIVKRTLRGEIKNSLTVYSQRNYQKSGGLEEQYKSVLKYEDLTQPGLADALPGTLELSFVQDATTAASLGAYWLGFWKRQRFEVDVEAGVNIIALEPADYIKIDSHPVLAAHGAIIFRVIGTRLTPATAGFGVSGIEVAFDALALSFLVGDPNMAYGSRGNRSTNNASTPNSKWDLVADAIVLRDAALTTIVAIDNPSTRTCDFSVAGPAANGRDQAGAFSSNSWVHVYWIWNGSTYASIASTNAPPTGPTLTATGYTHWGYEGSVRLDGSGNIVKMYHRGDEAHYQAVQTRLSGGVATTETSVDLSASVPPNAKSIDVDLDIGGTAATTAHSETLTIRLVTTVDYDVIGLQHFTNTGGVRQGPVRRIPNVGAAMLYLFSGHGGNGGTTTLDVNVLAYTMPNGGA